MGTGLLQTEGRTSPGDSGVAGLAVTPSIISTHPVNDLPLYSSSPVTVN